MTADPVVLAKLDAMIGMVRDVQTEQKHIRDILITQGERIARVEGRIEEQSKLLQLALAGRQSRKPAA